MDLNALSIKSKLIAMTFVVVVLCALSIVFLTIYQHQRLYEEDLGNNLKALSGNLADDLFSYVAPNEPDFISVTTSLLKLERYQNIQYGLVLDTSNNIISQYLNPKYYQSVSQLPKIDWAEKVAKGSVSQHDVFIEINLIGEKAYPQGHLIIVADLSYQLSQSRQVFIQQLIPLVVLTLLVIFLLSHWVQSGLINPLLSLSKLVSTVGNTKNYTLRYINQSQDEISILGDNINKMLGIIHDQDLENKHHTIKLMEQKESLKHLANYDQLTGLPNRKLFTELLKQELIKARRNNQELAVVFLDLDDFKTVNDTIGHHAGDILLQQVSERIKTKLREVDIFARLGGDEFILVLTELPSHVTAIGIIERILDSFEDFFYIKEWEIQSGLSMGIAFNEKNRFDAAELISNADVAMYRAKDAGRGNFAIFEDAMQSIQHRHMLIANELKKALQNDEFELYYQPKVSPDFGVVGFEALIRWNSTFDGFISPAEFIPVAEHCGRIHDITCWVLREGIKNQSYIDKHINKGMVTSFNVSAIDINRDGFTTYIEKLLKETGCATELIEFEVTESSYIENFKLASHFFEAIADLGCKIALDDFGTGYSSLSYLTQVKADTLKIDQQFIRKMFTSDNDRLIVESIIGLAKKLNLQICAEGIETIEQYEFLAGNGCEQIQGYYFAKPVPISELLTTVNEIHHRHSFIQLNSNVVRL